MAKKEKATAPEGYKTYKKVGGGSIRFANRIIKSGQIFAIQPDAIPANFKDTLEETAYIDGIVIVDAPVVKKSTEKDAPRLERAFSIKKAKDENGELLRDGDKILYNVVSEADGKVVSEKALTKGKAQELADAMNS